MADYLRYSASLVSQGKHRFYTLTMPSEVLARTCFVVSRDEDPKEGFQRLLDQKRAQQIADYIDIGFGTIPNSIVLSAQPEADFKYVRKGKVVEFLDHPKAFLILDGQHRVYGFHLAKTDLRVPVVVYNDLSRKDESKLFIDINTKQRPVPNELLLDIRRLAEYQDDAETRLGQIFDMFNDDPKSPLTGLLSPSRRRRDRISRVTFNAGVKTLLGIFGENSTSDIYGIISAYLTAFLHGARARSLPIKITNPTVFRGMMILFPEVARRVQDKFGKNYTTENFDEVLKGLFKNLKSGSIKTPGNSATAYAKILSDALKAKFSL